MKELAQQLFIINPDHLEIVLKRQAGRSIGRSWRAIHFIGKGEYGSAALDLVRKLMRAKLGAEGFLNEKHNDWFVWIPPKKYVNREADRKLHDLFENLRGLGLKPVTTKAPKAPFNL